MKTTEVTQEITLTIEGKTFKLSRNEATRLRDQLSSILNPSSVMQDWKKAFDKFTPCTPATPPHWHKDAIPMQDLSPRIICKIEQSQGVSV